MPEKQLITLHEAAELLGVHYMTAYRYVRTGTLRATQSGARWMVDPADIETLRQPVGEADGGGGGTRTARRGAGRVKARQQMYSRLVAGDEAGCWATVEATLASGADPAEVYMEVLIPALREIGDEWAAGRISVTAEHRASAVAGRLVGRLGPRFARRGRPRGTVVIGSAPNERHSLPSAILADILRSAGFQVVDLGADTPVESWVEAASVVDRLVAVLVGGTGPGRQADIAAAVAGLRGAGVKVPVLTGGAAVPSEEAARSLGADGWTGPDAVAALAKVEEMIRRSA